ncbi:MULTISPECIES: hypothetical protein [Rhizobium]|uniref:hypothetical protein n=1 Tax=Rhizobium TaxID=379 RepID=UPI001C8295BD|nr:MULTISPECIES: hypothetical protein [Rhizobium]MBX5013994.1 hypothetical protein [Rhizobium lentis]MBY3122939.1 hypothetical protein [Rhizobium laguerreae]MBY3447157.1 hypothetical protein [Rhizobium laguerreae]
MRRADIVEQLLPRLHLFQGRWVQQLTGRFNGMLFNSGTVSRVGQGTSAVMFDNHLTLQGEWRGWRSSFARKFGVIACRSAPRFSSRLENFVRIRCMISLGFASV